MWKQTVSTGNPLMVIRSSEGALQATIDPDSEERQMQGQWVSGSAGQRLSGSAAALSTLGGGCVSHKAASDWAGGCGPSAQPSLVVACLSLSGQGIVSVCHTA